MSAQEFITQKKGKSKKKVQVQAQLEDEPIVVAIPPPVAPILPSDPPIFQTKPKKISPLIRNAINAQPEELQFKKVDSPSILQVDVDTGTDDEEDEEDDSIVDELACPGCYYCNWTGVNLDNDNGCKRHYYGDVN